MQLVPNKTYKLKVVMEQMEDIYSQEEFLEKFNQCFPVVWHRIQCYHDMDIADRTKRKGERIPEPSVYVARLYQEALKNYEKEMRK